MRNSVGETGAQRPYNCIIIAGPTAVGKSEAALAVCERYSGEIVSADSMQIYRGLDLGTAKPSAEEQSRIPHHMIDIAEPGDMFSVAEYRNKAEAAIRDVLSRDKLPVITGGSGLYLNSLIYDMDFSGSPADQTFRDGLYSLAEKFGNEYIHSMLKSVDSDAAATIHPNDSKKVIRALERIEKGGETEGLNTFEQSFRKSEFLDPRIIVLTRPREDLYEMIEDRTDKMIEAGLEGEVRQLAETVSDNAISLLGIGYKEMLAYIRGEYDLGEAVRLIKRNSRRYAKRQLTWFRRWENASFFEIPGRTLVAESLPQLFAIIEAV